MVWVVLGVLWVGQALLTARVAVAREHDRVLWLVLGLAFPVAALVALGLGHPRSQSTARRLAPDLEDALRKSRIARVLARDPGLDAEAIRAATGLPDDRVVAELRTLRMLGLVRRQRDRTYVLTPAAASALDAEG